MLIHDMSAIEQEGKECHCNYRNNRALEKMPPSSRVLRGVFLRVCLVNTSKDYPSEHRS